MELERRDLARLRQQSLEALEEAEARSLEAAERYDGARAAAAADYSNEVEAMEARMESLVRDLKAQSGDLVELAGDTLAELRLVASKVASDADTTPELPVIPITNADILVDGETLVVTKRGLWFGTPGTVIKSSRNQVELEMPSGDIARLKKADVARTPGPGTASRGASSGPGAMARRSRGVSFLATKAEAAERRKSCANGDMPGTIGGVSKRTAAYRGISSDSPKHFFEGPSRIHQNTFSTSEGEYTGLRTSANTIDLLGCTVDEAVRRVEMVSTLCHIYIC